MWHVFNVGDLNIGDGRSADKVADLVNLVENHGISVFFGQEFGDRADVVTAFLRKYPHWRVVWKRKKNKFRDVPILYDNRVWKKTLWTELAIRIGYLGPQGAGGNAPGFKGLNIVRLKHRKAKRTVQFQTHHTIASAFNPHVRGAEHRRRVAAYTRQVNKFFARTRVRFAVIGGGDWNGKKTNRVIQHHKPHNWHWIATTATFRKDSIDLLGYTSKSYLRTHGGYVVETSGSKKNNDHRAVVASFSIRS